MLFGLLIVGEEQSITLRAIGFDKNIPSLRVPINSKLY
jgi:hypothetical protein